MEPNQLTQSPFAALTFVAAPALLTNASSVLALSTINRMLATRARMTELFNKSEAGRRPKGEAARLVTMVDRVETQAGLLLRALHSIYLALASFACATLVTLLGATIAAFHGTLWLHIVGWIGILLGIAGVGGLVFGCAALFQATQLSLMNIRDEAVIVRERQAPSQKHDDE